MNQQEAHVLTLWCAVLAKTSKGVVRLLPDGLSLAAIRVLCQLSRHETPALSQNRLAHALVLRPSETEAACNQLLEKKLIQQQENSIDCAGRASYHVSDDCGCQLSYCVSDNGKKLAESFFASANAFNRACWSKLEPADFNLLMNMIYDAMVRPGSYFANMTTRECRSLQVPDHYYVTCMLMLASLVDCATKCSGGLSITDYRFLLELYPKRRNAEKLLRAKELTARLAVGRAYISTASLRLEEQGYIERVPDPQDMRGVLFRLTPNAYFIVSQVGDDLMVAFDSLFRPRREQTVEMIHMLKALLEGTDKALCAKDGAYERR